MRISGNFSTPNFNRLYKKQSEIAETVAKLSKDDETKKLYEERMAQIEKFAETQDILIRSFDGKGNGIKVQRLDPATLKATKLLAYSKKDFMDGLYLAIRRLTSEADANTSISTKRCAPRSRYSLSGAQEFSRLA